jgi:2-polyprenyl-3-methyl-5-hydroxy-6-metoxy-1,4-benzoquinol methylase
MAEGGAMDLEADEALAAQLDERADELSLNELKRMAAELRRRETTAGLRTAAVHRFNARYQEMEAEIGNQAGQAILNKLNPYLIGRGRSEVGGKWSLEAGGAEGLFLPDFARLFSGIAFLDCSLANLVVARKLAQEHGLSNVAFVRGDVMALPFRGTAFQFVHENNVIEHVADPETMVKEGLRVTAAGGTYVCVSPNRFSVAPEPHFRLAGFGFFPRGLRRHLIWLLRGVPSEQGTHPRSLGELRSYLGQPSDFEVSIFFLPRKLPCTARKTPLRRAVRSVLALPVVGRIVSELINGPLLGLMPYHVAVAIRASQELINPKPLRVSLPGSRTNHRTAE